MVSSFGQRWFDTWLPDGYTTSGTAEAWDEFALLQVIVVTLEVSVLVVGLSLLIGVPAAYALARRLVPGQTAGLSWCSCCRS